MQNNALVVNGLTTKYQDLVLDDVSFVVPNGVIVGLIGENGAGKSTIINTILGLIRKEAGSIELLGRQSTELDNSIRNQIGVVFDDNNYPEVLSAKQLNNIFKKIFDQWDEKKYFRLLKKMALPVDKKIKEFSKGMKIKLSMVVAFSHNPKLLILDEVTSGLDPIARDDLLEMFLDFVQDENNSILVSSHITSDLEKVADYIVFIHNGKVVFSKPKDELRYKYGIIKCKTTQFNNIDKKDIITYRKQDYGCEILVADRIAAQKKYSKVVIDPATIEEIMLFYVKGEII